MVAEQQLFAGRVGKGDVGADLRQVLLDLGVGGESGPVQARHVDVGLESDDGVVPAARLHDEDVRLVAGDQDVVATLAVEQLQAVAVADQDVVEIVADAPERTIEQQVLDVRRQGHVHRRKDGVDALVGVFDDLLAGIVDVVCIVAQPTDHGVVGAAAIVVDGVVRRRAIQHLGGVSSRYSVL